MTVPVKEADRRALQEAKALLENPGLAALLADVVGQPIEKGLKFLPARLQSKISAITQKALLSSLQAAVFTAGVRPAWLSSKLAHKVGAASTGFAGGFFGAAGLVVELPISTTVMMRAIATIARDHNEDISTPESRMACLEVFALGGPATSDDGTETGYYAARNAVAGAVNAGIKFLASGGDLGAKNAPVLLKIIATFAERFSIQVTEKAVAQALPVIGAVSAALINLVFTQHFQQMASGHFTVRNLERKYGPEAVKKVYAVLPSRP